MKKSTENWLKIAKCELNAADTLFEANNYLKSVEHCHAALEKILKGLITEDDQTPEKIHNLLRLASTAIVENLQKDILDILEEVNEIFISTRYPEEYEILLESLNHDRTKNILVATKRTFKWLETKLK